MQQPQMNPNTSYPSQDGKGTNLPSGPKPTCFITNEKPDELSDDELTILKTKVVGKIRGRDKSLSAICISNFVSANVFECPFCRSINSQFQNKEDATQNLFHQELSSSVKIMNSSGFRGCEQNNLIFHILDGYASPIFMECFSRARETLMVILSKEENYFSNTIKEILTHDQQCENRKCKQYGWNELKVVDVEYIGCTADKVKQNYSLEELLTHRISYIESDNPDNLNLDVDDLGPDSSSENSDKQT